MADQQLHIIGDAGERKELETAVPANAENDASWPVPVIPMPGVFDVQSTLATDGETPMVVIAIYQPCGATFYSLTREDALDFASTIKRVAQTGPSLDSDEVPD